MADFFEIDFLAVEAKKSGDAIALRYELGGYTSIHVVDGGFQATGASLAEHIRAHYGNPTLIDHVVVTHQDGDHAGGVRTILEEFNIGALWMHRPWLYAGEIINRFANYTSVEHLKRRLRAIYTNLAALEDIALERGIPIFEPFQGAAIGAFRVMAPSRARFLDLVVESDKTPEHVEADIGAVFVGAADALVRTLAKAVTFVMAAWGVEVFSPDGTTAENEMSVVQYANLCGKRVLLTGDAGRGGLQEAAAYAPFVGLSLPGIDRFQVPHHGSRRNVSTELLDLWLGPRLADNTGAAKFTAIVSSALEDQDHPRKAVVRALIHRGANGYATEGKTIQSYHNAPDRYGWSPATPETYPEDQEE
jgi:hypothetical protein